MLKTSGLCNLANKSSNPNSVVCKSCSMYLCLKLCELHKNVAIRTPPKIIVKDQWHSNYVLLTIAWPRL